MGRRRDRRLSPADEAEVAERLKRKYKLWFVAGNGIQILLNKTAIQIYDYPTETRFQAQGLGFPRGTLVDPYATFIRVCRLDPDEEEEIVLLLSNE